MGAIGAGKKDDNSLCNNDNIADQSANIQLQLYSLGRD
jgi:hypothetical protein